MESEIKAVILDLDGALIDSTTKSIGFHRELAKHLKLRVPDREELRKLWGLFWPEVVETVWPGLDIEYFRTEYIKFDKGETYPAIKGARLACQSLIDQGLILTLLTSRDFRTLFHRLSDAGLSPQLFSFIQTPDNSHFIKPNPRVFDKMLKKLVRGWAIRKENMCYVGDTIYDFRAAQGAGVKFIAVLSGAGNREEFEEAGVKIILNSITDLPAFLENLTKRG